ncbi:hypothetical protein B0O99DRAFT_55948 [Bisporella sp. PMI_857]|nr:hypothetical protein B0O99DRAFT_55948 [Bisporella sp. PMI_857]
MSTKEDCKINRASASADSFYKQVELYFSAINQHVNGTPSITQADQVCCTYILSLEMCLRDVRTLNLKWNWAITLEYWISCLQKLWENDEDLGKVEKLDVLKVLRTIEVHVKKHTMGKMKSLMEGGIKGVGDIRRARELLERGEQILEVLDQVKQNVAIGALRLKVEANESPSYKPHMANVGVCSQIMRVAIQASSLLLLQDYMFRLKSLFKAKSSFSPRRYRKIILAICRIFQQYFHPNQ